MKILIFVGIFVNRSMIAVVMEREGTMREWDEAELENVEYMEAQFVCDGIFCCRCISQC